jgi:hypothetical protein
VGIPVTFSIVAHEAHAPGQLHYTIAYGDGSSDANVTDELCSQPPGPPASDTWSLTHRYEAPGDYTVVLTVAVNCSSDKATASLTVNPV